MTALQFFEVFQQGRELYKAPMAWAFVSDRPERFKLQEQLA